MKTKAITPAIIKKNSGNPNTLFKSNLSTLSVKSNLDFIEVVNVLAKIPLTLPYLCSANIVSLSLSYLSSSFNIFSSKLFSASILNLVFNFSII